MINRLFQRTIPHVFSTTLMTFMLVLPITTVADSQDQPHVPELVLLNWSEYIDPALVKKFEAEFKVKLREVYYENDETRTDMLLETNGREYDLVLVSGLDIHTYKRQGWLEPLNTRALPNLKHLMPRWRSAFPDAEKYAVPYFWGTLGIAYRKDMVDPAPGSWMDLYRPAKSAQGKIAMIETSRDVLGTALKALGHSVNSTDPAAIEAAGRLVREQRPHVKTYEYITLDEKSALLSGDVVMSLAYNGDALMLQDIDPNVEFIVPEEGTGLYVDYLVVLAQAKNKDLAWKFINFLNVPSNAKQLAEYVYFATPNKAAEKKLPAEFLTNPVIYPTHEVLKKSEFNKLLPPRIEKKRNNIFSQSIN